MDDPMKPIRDIRARAQSDLALFRQVETTIGVQALPNLHVNSVTLVTHLEGVVSTADKLIADYERDNA